MGWLILGLVLFSLNNLAWYLVGKTAGEEIHLGRDDLDRGQ